MQPLRDSCVHGAHRRRTGPKKVFDRMKAIVHTAYGAPLDVLRLSERPIPTVSARKVLIRIRAASVNAGDWHLVRGVPRMVRLAFGLFRPKHDIIGSDCSGVVEAVGADVEGYSVGDEVFCDASLVGMGAFAEYIAVPVDVLCKKPRHISFEAAAALPGAGVTALQGLRDYGRLHAGHRVLINGASGGVGSHAVQIAVAMGAHVTAVCSTRNVDFVRGLGAHEVVDYTKTDITTLRSRFDVFFDGAAYRPFSALLHLVSDAGTYVFVGGGTATMVRAMTLGPLVSRAKGKRVASFMARANAADLRELATLVERGALTSPIDRLYAFDHTAEAVAYVETNRARGRVVIDVMA